MELLAFSVDSDRGFDSSYTVGVLSYGRFLPQTSGEMIGLNVQYDFNKSKNETQSNFN